MHKTKHHTENKSESPTHRSVSLSEIRLTRITGTTTVPVSISSGSAANSRDDQMQTSPIAHHTQSQTTVIGGGGGQTATASTQLTAVGVNSATTTLTSNTATGTIVTIKQEQLATVDNLVGSYVDSTTFLHSPSNSQMVNPNLVQSNCLVGASGESLENKKK